MEINKTLNGYLEELSSSSPTPGGGNVAALCGVLSASLGVMVCNLTIGKKKYAEAEEEIKKLKEQLEKEKEDFIYLARKDNEAFDGVMNAFKLPKESEEEKQVRLQKIEEATLQAAVIPSEVIKKCESILPLISRLTEIGNQNSLSDSGVAISLLSTASEGAFLNVLINCSGIKGNDNAVSIFSESEQINNRVKEKTNSLLIEVKSKLT
jgi:formiminotetrahydrofolate cyclodeaminase